MADAGVTRIMVLQVQAAQAIAATRDLETANRKLAQAAAMAGTAQGSVGAAANPKALNQYSDAVNNVASQGRALRGVFQNVTYQVADFAVVMGQGQGFMRAFAQQGTQAVAALSLLGGAIGGISLVLAPLIAIGFTLGEVFLRLRDTSGQAAEASDTVGDSISALERSLSALTTAQEGYAAAVVSGNSGITAVYQRQIELRERQLEIARAETTIEIERAKRAQAALDAEFRARAQQAQQDVADYFASAPTGADGFVYDARQAEAFSDAIQEVLADMNLMPGELEKARLELEAMGLEVQIIDDAMSNVPENTKAVAVALEKAAEGAKSLSAGYLSAANSLGQIRDLYAQGLDSDEVEIRVGYLERELEIVAEITKLRESGVDESVIQKLTAEMYAASAEIGYAEQEAQQFEDVLSIAADTADALASTLDAGGAAIEGMRRGAANLQAELARANALAAGLEAGASFGEASAAGSAARRREQAAADRDAALAKAANIDQIAAANELYDRQVTLIDGIAAADARVAAARESGRSAGGGGGGAARAVKQQNDDLEKYLAGLDREAAAARTLDQAFRTGGEAALQAAEDTLKLEEALRKANEQIAKFGQAQGLSSEQIAASQAQAEQALRDTAEAAIALREASDSAITGIGDAIGQTLVDSIGELTDGLVEGTLSFSEFTESLLKDMAKLILQMQLVAAAKAAIDALGNGFGGGGFSFGGLSPFGRAAAAAVPAVATAGLFAASPGGGSTGFSGNAPSRTAVGGGVSVQVINQTAARIETQEARTSDGRMALRVMVRDEIAGAMGEGSLDRNFRVNYGLTRRGSR